jgi:NodT family efflux transporter outer membrane factor (OMF) lipoprotein
MRLLLAAASALTLAACTVGPDFRSPERPATASGAFISTSSALVNAPVEGDWWRLYDDPVLDALIADALAANTDVRVAVARIERARAILRGARADRLPQATVGGSANYGQVPRAQSLPGADREGLSVDAGIDISYEADLFGRVRRGVEASRADLFAAEADANAVRVIVVAETARAYADAASAAQRIDVAERIVALLDQSLSLTERRHQVGLATGLDTARIATLRDQRRANIPLLVAQRQGALFRLAELTGRTPGDLPEQAALRRTPPDVGRPIPVGDGAALLARRPDIRAAEERLAAATARIGVATADLYPRITLGGSAGSTATTIADLFTGGALRWLVGGLINWTVNPEPARARIQAAEADAGEALATFDGVVLRALRETETALSAYGGSIERRAALEDALRQASRAGEISRARQREGDISGLELLDAERTLADVQATLAAADAEVASAQIDLFRALGGNWN